MATFLYAISKATAVPIQSPRELTDAGLEYVDPERGGRSNHVVSGPAGTAAAIWSMKPYGTDEGAPDPLYDASKQIWVPGGREGVMVGMLKDARPHPDALRRQTVLDGKPVTLLDGNRWTIPIVQSIDPARLNIPSAIGRRDGRFISKPHPRFRSVGERAFRVYATYIGQADPLSSEELITLAVDALAINYRLSIVEAIDLLELLDTENTWAIVRALADLDLIDKKAEELNSFNESTASAGDATTCSGGAAEPAQDISAA